MGKFITVVVVIALVVAGWNSWQEHKQVEPFSSALKSYLTIADQKAGDAQLVHGKKIIPVDVASESIDRAYFLMNDEVKPTTPGEVGAVARIRYESEAIGHYGRFGSGHYGTGYVWLANIDVVDLATSTVVAHASFRGSDPAHSKKGHGDSYGSRPSGQIADWLAQVVR